MRKVHAGIVSVPRVTLVPNTTMSLSLTGVRSCCFSSALLRNVPCIDPMSFIMTAWVLVSVDFECGRLGCSYVIFTIQLDLSMRSRHHWTIKPAIIYRPHYALINTPGGPANVHRTAARTEIQNSLGRVDVSIQSSEGDVNCKESVPDRQAFDQEQLDIP
jgi:hypothetical protein